MTIEGDKVHIIGEMVQYSTEFISDGGPLFGFFIVFLECFIPALPLSLFVALNVNAFGFFFGVVISWLATCLGSFLCYLLFYYLEEKFISRFLGKKMLRKVQNSIDVFQNIRFFPLIFIITLPFTPSFLINILSGLSRMPREKYIMSILIGKVFAVVFWGYVGKSIIAGLTDIRSLIYIGISLLFTYILSKVVGKKMHIE